MFVSQAELDLILNAKIRQRFFSLPVRYGPLGERKRCPARVGGVYRLRAVPPLEIYRRRAESQPTAARRVLAYITQCELPRPSVLVTVFDVALVGEPSEHYRISFERGDQSAYFDRAVFLRPGGGYTTEGDVLEAGEVAVGSGSERARIVALAKRYNQQEQNLQRARGEVQTLRESMVEMKRSTRNRLALIERELQKLAVEMTPASVLRSAPSDSAERQAPAEYEGELRSNGSYSVPSLESETAA